MRQVTYTPRFEIGEKVDYGYVINRQLDRIAEIRSKVFKSVGGDVFNDVVYNRALDYISHLESLYALLLPELKGDVGTMLRDAKDLVIRILNFHSRCRHEEEKEKCRKLWDKVEKLGNELCKKYGLRNFGGSGTAFEICDKALESMIASLNSVGLLLRGKPVKLGTAGEK